MSTVIKIHKQQSLYKQRKITRVLKLKKLNLNTAMIQVYGVLKIKGKQKTKRNKDKKEITTGDSKFKGKGSASILIFSIKVWFNFINK